MIVPLRRPKLLLSLGILAVAGAAFLWLRGGPQAWSERSLARVEAAIENGHVGDCLDALDPDYPYLRLWPGLGDIDTSALPAAGDSDAEPAGRRAARVVLLAVFAASSGRPRDLRWSITDLRPRQDGGVDLRVTVSLAAPDQPALAVASREVSLRLRFHGWLWPRGRIIDHDPIRGGGYG